jgi:hypothetical protein
MPEVVTVDLKWDDPKLSLMNRNAVSGLFRMGFDIAAQARRNAPYVTGALHNTIRVHETSDSNTLEVIAGGTFAGYVVNYAWIREQGPNRNPDTEQYMENAANTIMSGNYLKKYFGGIV